MINLMINGVPRTIRMLETIRLIVIMRYVNPDLTD